MTAVEPDPPPGGASAAGRPPDSPPQPPRRGPDLSESQRRWLPLVVGVAWVGAALFVAGTIYLRFPPSRGALMTICGYLAVATVFPLAYLVGRAGERAAVGVERLEKGLCPWCGYDVRTHSGRCPECGWAIVDPAKPLARPVPSPASPPLVWSSKKSATLYVTWTLAARPPFSPAPWPDDPLRREVAASLAGQCRVWVRSRACDGFLPEDLWGLMVLGQPTLKSWIDASLQVPLAHGEYAALGAMTFAEVVSTLVAKGATRPLLVTRPARQPEGRAPRGR